jgi:hypothetical protein
MQPPLVLPLPSTNQRSDPLLRFDGGSLLLTVFLRDRGEDSDWAVEFRRVRAFVHRAETLCRPIHYDSSYDQVVIIESSTWSEIVSGSRDETLPSTQNFAITLDSWGCLEVLAAEVALSDR